ncbi:unnamed protein product [Rangifer tarandus platyrhynchus]|uniref:Uncharacterized protein n=2 Tax=Rangifer tarandus platyrhynchus TaxID=3082113 RepID=A0ABN8ZQ71_RANTA|nr:unnamed protein product [Rangifer tarandus platyrhynchus]CAI9706085.1 unnamed protein product [Rangifer tarandus platyrhynchus]
MKRPQLRPRCLLGAVVVLSPHHSPNPGPTSNEKHRGTAWNYQSRQALRREPAARPASVARRERGGEPEEAGSEDPESGSFFHKQRIPPPQPFSLLYAAKVQRAPSPLRVIVPHLRSSTPGTPSPPPEPLQLSCLCSALGPTPTPWGRP